MEYLMQVAHNLGIQGTEIDQIMSNPDAYPLTPPKEEAERMRILYYLLFAMRIDNEIHDKEIKFIYEIGLKLGFVEPMLTDFITEMKSYTHQRLPDDALLKVLKKYQN